jgi:PEP-CTERM motif
MSVLRTRPAKIPLPTQRNSTMKKLTTLLTGVALAAGANAATVTLTDSFGLATTNWTHLIGASQFNGVLGTLNSATFTFADDIVQRFKAENVTAVSTTMTPVLGAQMLFRKSLATLLTTTLTGMGTPFFATAFDGISDFAGTSGKDFGALTANANGTITLTGAALASLIGIGTLGSVGYDVRAIGSGSIMDDVGKVDSSISTQARYNLVVTYDYTPASINGVPEPGAVALVGVALAGLAFMRRKAKRS